MLNSRQAKSFDPSQWSLLFTNVLVLAAAVIQRWPPIELIIIYWIQSVMIGVVNVIRILNLKDFSVQGYFINNQPAKKDNYTKFYTAIFFAAHYGLFHLVYGLFIFLTPDLMASEGYKINTGYLLGIALLFFLNHLFSYLYNKPKDETKQNIGGLLFFPYIRILPMHLVILFGGFFNLIGSQYLTIFFGAMKTAADMAMHRIEHKI